MRSTAPSLHTLLGKWRSRPASHPDFQAYFQAYRQPAFYPSLHDIYRPAAGGALLTHEGICYPAVFFPAKQAGGYPALTALNLRFDAAAEKVHPPIPPVGLDYLRTLRARSQTLWDGPTARLTRLDISTDNVHTLHWATGSYFPALASADLLELEYLLTFIHHQREIDDRKGVPLKLPLREALHAQCDPLRNGSGRSAAMGISAAVIFADNSGYSLLLRYCRAKVPGGRHFLHVVPSGMAEPLDGHTTARLSLMDNIVREYVEEVFDEDVDSPAAGSSRAFLQQLEQQEVARWYYTGMAIDLLKLRPEICTVLIIDSVAWIEAHRRGAAANYSDLPTLHAPRKTAFTAADARRPASRLISVPLAADGRLPAGLPAPHHFSPPGAAAVMAAIDCLGSHPRGTRC